MAIHPVEGLLEREQELARLTELVASVSGRDGAVAVIEGAAGIGKTRLLAAVREQATRSGMTVLAARGAELEREFSFGVVRQLFEPALAGAGDREAAFAGAAALAEPLLSGSPAAAVGDPFAIYHGLYWVAANLAAERPLLLAVDDLHWCDTPSLEFLDFLGRRLDGVQLLVATAVRPSEPRANRALIDSLLSGPAAAVLAPQPLSPPMSARLVGSMLGEHAEPAFADACHDASGGNPLLLTELLKALAAEQVEPTAAEVDRVREIGPQAVARAMRMRLAALSPEATRLAESAAVLGDGSLLADAGALAGLDPAGTMEQAAGMERIGILRPGDRVEFVHPLLRAAIYDSLGLVGQRLAHTRAARLLTERARPAEQIAAQILVSPPNDDPAAVEVLRTAAARSLADGSASLAVTYLERALLEPPPEPERAEVLISLGGAEALVNGPNAAEHLREAIGLTADPVARARILLVLGRALYFASRIDEAAAAFQQGLGERGLDPATERSLETGLVVLGLFEPSLIDLARERLERFDRDAPADGIDDLILLAYGNYDDLRTFAVDADTASRRAHAAYAGRRVLEQDSQGAWAAIQGTLFASGRVEDAAAVGRAVLEAGEAAGSAFLVSSGLSILCLIHCETGRLADAVADGELAIATASSHGFHTVVHWAAAWCAHSQIERGAISDARGLADRLGFGQLVGDSMHLHAGVLARARLLTAEGRPAEAAELALEIGRRCDAAGCTNPTAMHWRAVAAEALLAHGRADEAAAIAAAEAQLLRPWGAPGPLARSLRLLGLATGGSEGIELLREAVAVSGGSPWLLEHATSQVELGAALRRANRRSEAREQLQIGLELAQRCGALGLTERAMTELRATGARPRRAMVTGRDALTPSELRVAELVSAGMTNREVAQRLFVTQKTVETHMARVFRKLGIESRAQIAGALRTTTDRPAP